MIKARPSARVKSLGRFSSFLITCLFSLLMCASTQGQNYERSVTQFDHTGWTIKDGAPGGISSIAQTADGYLWLGTNTGLFRFDGIRFERFEPLADEQFPSVSIQSLYAPPTGGLWIGFQLIGASFLKDGHITNYTQQEGLNSTVSSFATNRDGAVWAATYNGLVRLENSQWQKIGQEWNYPENTAKSLLLDRDGNLWAATGKSVVYLPPDTKQFQPTGVQVGWVAQMTQARDGKIWLAEASSNGAIYSLTRQNNEFAVNQEIRGESAGLIFDLEDSLWIANLGEGIRRLSWRERLDKKSTEWSVKNAENFTQKDGLTADYVVPALEDREGNIWFGTSGGLDRFRRSPLVPAGFPAGSHDFALAAGAGGIIWAGTTNQNLMRFKDKILTFREEVKPEITCAYRDADGIIWLGGTSGIWRISGEEIIKVADLPDGNREQVQAITKDRSGALWVSANKMPLLKFSYGVWTRFDDHPELSKKIALVASTDALGRVWLGYLGNRITIIDGENVQTLNADAGLDLGNITAILQTSRRTWVGGSLGLAFFDGVRFYTVKTADGNKIEGVSAIIETDDGDFWLNSISGIIRISAEDIRQVVEDADYPVKYEIFNYLDGLPGPPTQLRPYPSAVKGSDGRLWFATLNGVVWLDPANIYKNPLPPPVSIASVIADDVFYPNSSQMNFPARTNQLQIDYAGLSLSIPERVHFKYKLEGVDADWQDVGSRRQAFYNNLAPGDYRFRVIASNNDGVWNEEGATLNFKVFPMFYQTKWFLLLCFVAAVSSAFAAFRWRVRHVKSRLRWQYEERLSERTRIAQELHDTLMQGVFSASIQLDAAVEQADENSAIKPRLNRVQQLMERIMTEGRLTIRELHLPNCIHSLCLEDAFSEIKEDLDINGRIDFRISVKGESRTIHPVTRYEIYRIGREALSNAFNHSNAEKIRIEIEYAAKYVRILIRDDGSGISPEILRSGRDGHYGLSVMRKRAATMDSKLKISSKPEIGTTVELIVPAAIAFETDSSAKFFKWFGGAELPKAEIIYAKEKDHQ